MSLSDRNPTPRPFRYAHVGQPVNHAQTCLQEISVVEFHAHASYHPASHSEVELQPTAVEGKPSCTHRWLIAHQCRTLRASKRQLHTRFARPHSFIPRHEGARQAFE